ncbi:SCO3242 family prenyltransferase [Streptomyces sp. AJS327]|uniref:SCO3242 family prenyltransferase n=1 Tax=Streptomyces sp. AJS327 TaxID=2545265 RepID=UPI0027E48025|nr:UbiA family prenyltransferase [Streptomyces sp. AJS327]
MSPGTGRAWAELLRLPAVLSVPGDALAGAAAVGGRPHRGTALAVGSALCLYEAGMALNDWADRAVDAVERPERPLPSGRIAPGAALAASAALTGAGLGLAALAGRPALGVAGALAATVWAYDLRLKHTVGGPAAMGAARALDLLLGAVATAHPRATARPASAALPSAALLGSHTVAVTAVSRREAEGGRPGIPVAAALAAGLITSRAAPWRPARPASTAHLTARAAAGGYLATFAGPLARAALHPTPPSLQRAVGGGIRATIPLQSALTARAGSPVTAGTLLALLPLARRLSRKVSPT